MATIELKVPNVGESIQEVQVAQWLKKVGDVVREDETVVELDTDKASVELAAPAAGVVSRILKKDGDKVSIGEVIGMLEPGDGSAAPASDESKQPAAKAEAAPSAEPSTDSPARADDQRRAAEASRERVPRPVLTPSARRELHKHGLRPDDIAADGERLRREDVVRAVESGQREAPSSQPAAATTAPRTAAKTAAPAPPSSAYNPEDDRLLEEVVPMSLIRRRIAARLVEAQHRAALLTTFNEVDLGAVIELRKTHGEKFLAKYGTKLGFMSFFVKASVEALKQSPEINAEIRNDTQIVYRNYYHIGIAIGGGRGLVVPVLRHADRLSFAEIELAIADFAQRAEKNKLEPKELEGGTFTISNGGIYGSLLSTPIVNPPQSGVLGMHTIQERPVARNGQVVIRPMMYLALSYDHRIVDGREAVTFLRRIKETLEDPARMLLEI